MSCAGTRSAAGRYASRPRRNRANAAGRRMASPDGAAGDGVAAGGGVGAADSGTAVVAAADDDDAAAEAAAVAPCPSSIPFPSYRNCLCE